MRMEVSILSLVVAALSELVIVLIKLDVVLIPVLLDRMAILNGN